MNLLADLDALGDVLPDGIVVVDAGGCIVWVNGYLCDLLHYERDALIGTRIEVLVPDAARERHVQHRGAFRGGDVTRAMGSGIDLRARRADGVPVPVDVSLRSAEIDGETVVVAAVRDLTAQHELEERNAFLDTVNDATRSAVFVIDGTASIAGCNRAAERLLGFTAASVVGRPMSETVLGDAPELIQIVTNSLGGRSVENERVLLSTRLGERLPVGVVSRPIRHRHRGIIGVSVLLFDLSEQESSQASLLNAQERLEITERLGGLGAWEYDPASGELQMSPGLFALMGVSPLDHDGTLAVIVNRIGTDDAAVLRDLLARCTDAGTPFYVEFALAHADGSRRWVGMSGGRSSDTRAGRGHAHGIVQDLTAHHEVTESLLLADQMKDEFVATVSHELRTPLTVILGFADHLCRLSDETTAPYFDAMRRNAREMDLMVDQLLDLSRVQTGRVDNDPRPHPVRTLVDDVLAYAAVPLTSHLVRNETGSTEVMVDTMGFRRILTNLLTNAAKFSERGTEIVVADEVRAGEVVVSVSDHGVGIAASELEQIFEQFVQARVGRPTDVRGTGVGLAIARRYVELAQGRIWAVSTLGGGSTFSFALPRAQPSGSRDTRVASHDLTTDEERG